MENQKPRKLMFCHQLSSNDGEKKKDILVNNAYHNKQNNSHIGVRFDIAVQKCNHNAMQYSSSFTNNNPSAKIKLPYCSNYNSYILDKI